MKANRKVYCAVAAILGAHAAAASAAAPAAAGRPTPAEADNSLAIGEVVVTAQRREESAQNVPIHVTALTAETLSKLNVTTFDDYVKYLPNVTACNQARAGARSTCAAWRTTAGRRAVLRRHRQLPERRRLPR